MRVASLDRPPPQTVAGREEDHHRTEDQQPAVLAAEAVGRSGAGVRQIGDGRDFVGVVAVVVTVIITVVVAIVVVTVVVVEAFARPRAVAANVAEAGAGAVAGDIAFAEAGAVAIDVALDKAGGVAVDLAFGPDNQAFRDRLAAERYTGHMEHREGEGAHAWRWWTQWLRDNHLPFFWDGRLAKPTRDRVAPSAIPATFRYRTIQPTFAIFGYDVSVVRPAAEFLDLTDVTDRGFTARGSGLVTVVTAPRYKANGRYVVDGVLTRADRAGRLRVVVDLGPGHPDEQYTPAGRAAEAAAGDAYWTTRTIHIAPA